ncbi:MAG: epoxyqueuosine reductase QueH [Clostridia bacterium]|nr:epoxyqueuosine reductase QueH [Clostridia bacterium]
MKLLVHTCCAPCLVYISHYLKENGIDYSSLFYNPNIHPYKEYMKRFEHLKKFMQDENTELFHLPSFMQVKWEKQSDNCDFCYKDRLETTVKFAKEHGFTHFTSSLLISPYQDHEKIKDIAKALANEYEVEFFYYDFRPNYREGQNMAREKGIYRQKYCGCIHSYRTSDFKDKITWD